MKITEALKSLEISWSREDVLLKIRNGADSNKIINDFFNNKEQEIQTLTKFISKENIDLLREVEELSNIESKLFNKIRNYKYTKINLLNKKAHESIKKQEPKNKFDLGIFMLKWSNKFVFISLLIISAIALSKQAWA